MRIGIVDLDTSHPAAWVPLERSLGHEVIGVYDSGDVHPAGYAKEFADRHQIPTVYTSLERMASDVDCAILHSCDWDTHVSKARPFVEAGKGVLVDKPFAGRRDDLEQFESWSEAGSRICGGSSLRFAAEVSTWRRQAAADRGQPQNVFCGCAVDEFNYGIHAYSLLLGIMGSGPTVVRSLGVNQQWRVEIGWADGRVGTVVIGATDSWLPFYATVVTGRSVTHLEIDSSQVYRSLLEACLPYLAGATELPLTFGELLDAERCALAAHQSRSLYGQPVALGDISVDVAYDGGAFAAAYREQRYADGARQ